MDEATFEPLEAPGPLSRDELQQDDDLELWIVRVPPQMSVEELASCKLPLTQGRTTRSGRVELTADTFVPSGLHVLLPNRKGRKLKPVSLPVAGQVVVHQRLGVPPLDPASAPVTSLLPQPPAVCQDRHPLLGVGYKKMLERNKQALATSEALDFAHSGSNTKKKRSKAIGMDSTDNSKRKKRKSKGP